MPTDGRYFPVEQARIAHLLIARVDVGTDGADIRLRTKGLHVETGFL
jgi:hypothetical protein